LEDCQAGLAYSDSDHLDANGMQERPVFRPDWSPDLLCSPLYPGAFFLTRADFSTACRIEDTPPIGCRVPRVLYHSRLRIASTERRPPFLDAALRQSRQNATLEHHPGSDTFGLVGSLIGDPMSSIIICSRTPRLLDRCIRGIFRKTTRIRRELIVVHHLGGDDSAMRALIKGAGAVCIPFDGAFNFSAMNNLGAQRAKGEILVFLNDDVEPLVSEWLESLVVQVQRQSIAIAGAKLLYPSGLLQHAGIAVGIGDGCGHPGRHTRGSLCFPWLNLARDVSAVTGACLAVRKDVFDELGGFDPEFPVNYNDVDLCLRAREAGYRVIYEPAAVLRHDECQTRAGGTTYEDRKAFFARWRSTLDAGDPFYNPNLTTLGEDAGLG